MIIKLEGTQPISVTEFSAFAPVAAAEVTTVSTVADSAGSLSGKYFTLNSANNATKYYCWMSMAAVAQVAKVTTVADSAGSLAGRFFKIYDGSNNPYYVWYSVEKLQATTITTVADNAGSYKISGLNEGKSFVIEAKNGNKYNVYFTYDEVAQVTKVVVGGADTEGSLKGKYFVLYSQSGETYVVYLTNPNHAEISDTATVADTADSLRGKYFTFANAGNATKYYTWYRTETAEKSTITAAADTANNLGSDYITFANATNARKYYAWVKVGTKEKSTITAAADVADSLDGDYITFQNAAGTKYYAWLKTSAGIDPAPIGYINALAGEIAITTGDIDTTVANAIRVALNAVSGTTLVNVTGADAEIILENAAKGTAEATNVTNATGFSVIRNATGSFVGSDPAPAGYETAGFIDITTGTVANDVAAAFRTLLDGNLDGITVTGATDKIILTNDDYGVAEAAGVSHATGFSVVRNITGGIIGTDPAVNGYTGIPVTIHTGDTAIIVAEKTRDAITATASTGVTVSGATNHVILTNDSIGFAENTDAGDSGFTVVITQEGEMRTEAPNVTGIKVPVDYEANAADTTIAGLIKDAIDALADFSATVGVNVGVDDTHVTITDANTGFVTSSVDGDTGWTITRETQGSGVLGHSGDGSYTYIPCTIGVGNSANTVGGKLRTALDTIPEFTITGANDSAVATDTTVGPVTNAANLTTSLTISVSAGVGPSADPNTNYYNGLSSFTGIKITIAPSDSANTVATKTDTIVHATSAFNSSVANGNEVSITNASAGACTAPSDRNTGFTIAVTTASRAASTDPKLPYKTGIPITVATGATAATIATAIKVAIDALADFAATVGANPGVDDMIVTVTNAANGDTTAAADVNTGFTITVTTPGVTALPNGVTIFKVVGTIPDHTEYWQGNTLKVQEGKTISVTHYVPASRIQEILPE